MTADIWSEIAGAGDAPPMMLVHGSMDRSAGLLRLSRRLDDRFCVLRYDRRGYGRSTAVGPPWTVAANVDDASALLERVSNDDSRAVVFGHSFGGNVALGLAERRPDLVRAVVVYETPLSWLDWWPGDSAGGMAVAAGDPGDAAEAFMRRLVGDDVWERLPAAKQIDRRNEGAAMVGELGDIRCDAPWEATAVDVPVLALCGQRGREHHRAATRALVDLLPDCRMEMIADAGHAGPHTHVDSVSAAIVGFVDGLNAGRTSGG